MSGGSVIRGTASSGAASCGSDTAVAAGFVNLLMRTRQS
jgi:hypothetical protein